MMEIFKIAQILEKFEYCYDYIHHIYIIYLVNQKLDHLRE